LGKKAKRKAPKETDEESTDEESMPAEESVIPSKSAESTPAEETVEMPAIDKSTITLKEAEKLQAEINLGTCGHVDHGKTTLTEALSGVRTDKYSEEVERGITIKLGYADTIIAKCTSCPEPDCYWTKAMIKWDYQQKGQDPDYNHCPSCGGEIQFLRKISFVDAPGHEILMATMLSGASLMDGAMLLVAADERCPMPQTKEHLAALKILGIDHVIVVQNKIDAPPKEQVIENYEAIKTFLQGSHIEDAPIVPISAVFHVNLHELVMYIEKVVPTPVRDPSKPSRFFIARSFDVNKPGTTIEELQGGVVGGSLSSGVFRVGDEIEIKPGVKVDDKFMELTTTIESISVGSSLVDSAGPGGLLGLKTKLDPSITKSDGLIGNILGKKGTLPPSADSILIEANLLDYVMGTEETTKVEGIKQGEKLLLSIGTTTTLGVVTSLLKNRQVRLQLVRRICSDVGMPLAISRQFNNRWRLVGYGKLIETQ
jgi:translation initiation factor 2 subunit 3